MLKRGVIYIVISFLFFLVGCSNNKISQTKKEQMAENVIIKENISNDKTHINNNSNENDKSVFNNLIVVNGLILGEFKDDIFYNLDELMNRSDWDNYKFKFNTNYNLYTYSNVHKSIEGNLLPNDKYIEYIDVENLTDDNVAMTIDVDIKNRDVEFTDKYTKEQEEVIRNILDNNKLENSPVVIKQVIYTDLDGDNIKEEIIYADNYAEYNTITTNDNETAILDKESISTFEQIGYYKIFVVVSNLKAMTLWEDYTVLTEEDFTIQTEYEPYLGDSYFLSDKLVYLETKEGKEGLFRPYEYSVGEGPIFQGYRIINLLDVNKDGRPELITYSYDGESIEINLLTLENKQIIKLLEQKFYSEY